MTYFGLEAGRVLGLGLLLGLHFVELGEDVGEGDADGGAGNQEDAFRWTLETVGTVPT